VKDFVKDYKVNRNWTYRSQRFSSGRLNKGLYCRYKDRGYATEVVIIAGKLPLDDFEDIKDSLGEA